MFNEEFLHATPLACTQALPMACRPVVWLLPLFSPQFGEMSQSTHLSLPPPFPSPHHSTTHVLCSFERCAANWCCEAKELVSERVNSAFAPKSTSTYVVGASAVVSGGAVVVVVWWRKAARLHLSTFLPTTAPPPPLQCQLPSLSSPLFPHLLHSLQFLEKAKLLQDAEGSLVVPVKTQEFVNAFSEIMDFLRGRLCSLL
jgi:hypothetical protein